MSRMPCLVVTMCLFLYWFGLNFWQSYLWRERSVQILHVHIATHANMGGIIGEVIKRMVSESEELPWKQVAARRGARNRA